MGHRGSDRACEPNRKAIPEPEGRADSQPSTRHPNTEREISLSSAGHMLPSAKDNEQRRRQEWHIHSNCHISVLATRPLYSQTTPQKRSRGRRLVRGFMVQLLSQIGNCAHPATCSLLADLNRKCHSLDSVIDLLPAELAEICVPSKSKSRKAQWPQCNGPNWPIRRCAQLTL